MRLNFFLFIVTMLLGSFDGLSQKRKATELDSVYLSDEKLKDFSTGQSLLHINQSIIRDSDPLLTNVLNFNTPIYFKENGLGMVSSPSFRGTTASQTAVVWNGININSQFNGQLDFNTINASSYSEISVRGGGGSVVYGTGAIGGSVHLKTALDYKEGLRHDLFVQYGSFNTKDARYSLQVAEEKWSLKLALGHNASDNDYDYPNNGKNLNGQFQNKALNVGLRFKLSHQNTIRLFSELFDGVRHFSLIRPSETRTKYEDVNSRNLVEWEMVNDKSTSIFRLAYLDENYRYFENIERDLYTFGQAETVILKHDFNYNLNKRLTLNSVLTNTNTTAEGSSLAENRRNIFAAALLMKHQLTENFAYEIGLREEITQNYKSPLLFSFGFKKYFGRTFALQGKASRNFRIPTYNNLYWTGAGNSELKPETSLQAELGGIFEWTNGYINLTAFYNAISDMIRWLPSSNGVWRPRNEDEVEAYGIESLFGWKIIIARNHQFDFSGTYAYTVSQNSTTGNQLIYVPYHKGTGGMTYKCKRIQANYQFLYVGEVFTRGDNLDQYNLDAYSVSNLAIGYELDSQKDLEFGMRIDNIFNKNYQSVENRWMPGRNFNLYLNFKI